MNCANASHECFRIMCYTNDLFETFCCSRYKINKLFNRIISKYKLVHSAPTTSHRYILYPCTCFANLLRNIKSRKFVRFRFLHTSRPPVACFRNHRTQMRHDLFYIYNLLYLRTHSRSCVQFLPVSSYHSNPWILKNFTSKRTHEAKLIRKSLRSASFTIHCLAFMPRFWLYESPAIVTNFYWFANACRRLLVIRSFRVTFETWSTIKRTICVSHLIELASEDSHDKMA